MLGPNVIINFVFVLCRWVNRKDPLDRNLFAGGFLGLDNVGTLNPVCWHVK